MLLTYCGSPVCSRVVRETQEAVGLPQMLRVCKKRVKSLRKAFKASKYLWTGVGVPFTGLLLLYPTM